MLLALEIDQWPEDTIMSTYATATLQTSFTLTFITVWENPLPFWISTSQVKFKGRYVRCCTAKINDKQLPQPNTWIDRLYCIHSTTLKSRILFIKNHHQEISKQVKSHKKIFTSCVFNRGFLFGIHNKFLWIHKKK